MLSLQFELDESPSPTPSLLIREEEDLDEVMSVGSGPGISPSTSRIIEWIYAEEPFYDRPIYVIVEEHRRKMEALVAEYEAPTAKEKEEAPMVKREVRELIEQVRKYEPVLKENEMLVSNHPTNPKPKPKKTTKPISPYAEPAFLTREAMEDMVRRREQRLLDELSRVDKPEEKEEELFFSTAMY